jgi:hypothetical protein
MKGQIKVKTPAEYLKALDARRGPQIEKLHKMIVKATRLKPYIQIGILSYGKYHYRYASGREGEWMCIGLASNANYISLYALAYRLDEYKARLPKAKLGKGCIRFKSVDDVDLATIEEIVTKAARMDGRTITPGDCGR